MTRDAYFYLVPDGVTEEDGVFDCAPFWPGPMKKGPSVRLPAMTTAQLAALWSVLTEHKFVKKGKVYAKQVHYGSQEEGGLPPIASLDLRLISSLGALEEADCRALAAAWKKQEGMGRRSENTLTRLLTQLAQLCRRAKEAGRSVYVAEKNES
jgi:hypothetical protein